MIEHEPIILASASKIRSSLLTNAGLSIIVQPADVDEGSIKDAFSQNGSQLPPADLAQLLAQTKAISVSEQHRGVLTIGADQILVHNGSILSKPVSVPDARDQLIDMRGKTHELISAVAVACDGEVLWSCEDIVRLTMRPFSNAFLGTYLANAGDGVKDTVGGYKLEGWGVHLFEKIEGDYFSVLGLPMIALLTYLRERNPNLA